MLNKRRRQTRGQRRKKRAQRSRALERLNLSAYKAFKTSNEISLARQNQAIRDEAYYHKVNTALELHQHALNTFLIHNGTCARAPRKALSLKRANLVQCTKISRRDSYLLLDYDTHEILFTCATACAAHKAIPFFKAQGRTVLTRRIL